MMKKSQKFPNPHPDDLQYAFNRATAHLSLRARSEKEIEDFLLKKDFNPTIIPKVIERLKDLKFLNDKEYARTFTRTRQEYKGKSKYFIKYELKQKGVSENLIDEVSSESQDDIKTAKDFIARKKRVLTRLDKKEFKEKIIRLLSSRGFSFDIITRALKESQETSN